MAVKKIPMRKCAGCEEMKEKKQLVRVVRTPEGEFVLCLLYTSDAADEL